MADLWELGREGASPLQDLGQLSERSDIKKVGHNLKFDLSFIQTPQDPKAAIQRMLNKILMGKAPLDHAGTFAQLANAWTRAYQTEMSLLEMKELEARIAELEDLKRYDESKRNESLDDMQKARKELKELMKQWR